MTALDGDSAAALFVSNVLNGPVIAANGGAVSQGSVVRIILLTPSGGTPSVVSTTIIASQFQERTDPNALVIGPTGLGLGADGTLYVADTNLSRVAAIPNALFRTDDAAAGITVSGGGKLNQPLGLAIAPNGNILTVNGSDGLIVETTPAGKQVASRNIDVSNQGGGTLFGLAIATVGNKGSVYFVDDGNNTLNILK
jgi:sugar lactone lactonase YvrE